MPRMRGARFQNISNCMEDEEANRFPRAGALCPVGANVGGVAARIAGARLSVAAVPGQPCGGLAQALGGLKGR